MARAAPAAPSAEIAADEIVRVAPLPNGAERRRGFDLFGRLRWEEHPDGSWLRYRYDGDGHPKVVEHRSGERVEYEVAEDGRRWTARRDGNTTAVLLDGDGLPDAVEQSAGSLDWHVGSSSDLSVYFTLAGSGLEFATGATTVEHVEPDPSPRVVGVEVNGVRQSARHDDRGRIIELDGVAVRYDAEGRLASIGANVVTYDEDGRLVSSPDRELRYGDGPMVTSATWRGRNSTYEYDASGRRVARHTDTGTTRYSYDLFGQLAAVELPSGERIDYRYDGFGRLVARTDDNQTVHYLVDIAGHRVAEAEDDGRITRSYLWVGDQCVGRVDGPIGGPLAATFHRGVSACPLAFGDTDGRLTRIDGEDPFGADVPIVDGAPGFGGLFGDPATGLLFAGTRWFDPEVAQFLTPDTWYGEDAANRAPRALRQLLDVMPGGTTCELTPVRAYAWCAYDPVNATDPSGHNWLGLVFSSISSLLWGMQATSLSFQMLMIDIILDLVQVVILRPLWDPDGYWDRSVFNIPAPTASERLMVPWAFWFNGLLRGPRAFTLGNVIWYSGTQLGELEKASERERVAAPEVANFVSATEAAAVDVFRARNPNTLVTGSVTAAQLDRVAGPAVTAPAGAALNTVLANNNVVAIRVVGAAADELRNVNAVGANITLDRDLPASFGGQNVEVRRLDPGVVRLTAGEASIARTISIIRGTSAHFSRQVPAGTLEGDTVTVDEFLPAGQPRVMAATVASEQILVDLGVDDLAPYAVGDAIRILSGGTYFARVVAETRPPAKLLLDSALPTGVHTGMEVARLLPGGGNAANQTASGARVTAGTLTDLAVRDGVAVDAAGAIERRIVTGLLLDCQVAALPAEFVDEAPQVAVVTPDVAVQTTGDLNSLAIVATQAGGTGSFRPRQPVEVRATAGAAIDRAVIEEVDSDANIITFKEELGGGFAIGDTVRITRLATTAATTFEAADPVAAPGEHVIVTVPTATSIAVNQLLHIRTSDRSGDVVRLVTVAPQVIAVLDSDLPASHTANLSVERLTPDDASVRTDASAPAARIRVQVGGAVNPYAVGEFIHIFDTSGLPNPGEEIIGEIASIDGQTLVLRDPSQVGLAANVRVVAVVATGITSADGKLGQTLVMIPSDPGEDPYTRRDALQNHEMRHVWQYAIWGPFFLSLPIPWLVHVGFSFTRMSNSVSKVARHVSVGGLDSLFALLFWGIGGAEGVTELEGKVEGNRRTVRFNEGSEMPKVVKFENGSRIEVASGDDSDYEVVDALDTSGTGSIQLRFELSEGRFADGDTVKVTISAFEQVRKTVSTWFSLNLENLWHDHIPTTWGRALSGLLNRDSWLPGLGLYVLSLMAAGGEQSRVPLEQDAAYHSGDLYTSITVSNPSTVFVGQFTRVFAFVDTRAGDGAAGISAPAFRSNAVQQLTVEMEGGAAIDTVAGAVPSLTAGEVRFRENWYLPLKDDIGNAVGALLAASQPGTYRLHAGGELTDDGVVMAGAGDIGALETRRITVRALVLTPDPSEPLFETESVTFAVAGDPTATYALRFGGGAAAGNGAVSGMQYTAPVLTGGATTDTQDLDITATYAEDHPVFRGPGQLDRDNLLAEQRTNLCQQLTITYNELTVAPIGPVPAGSTTDAEVPISPAAINVGAPSNPAAVTGDLRVMNLGGRPAQLQVLAPAAVTAAVDFPVEFVFGADPAIRKSIPITIRVTP